MCNLFEAVRFLVGPLVGGSNSQIYCKRWLALAMRWIFYSLIVLNLILLIWRYAIGLPVAFLPQQGLPAVDSSAQTSVDSLVLSRESLLVSSADKLSESVPHRKLCRTVGPYDSRSMAKDLINRLAALDARAHLHTLELKAGASHWVFLPPELSRQAARRRLAELQGRGLDSYIIPKGELENGISLGVFSRLDLALSRQKALAKKGLTVKVQSIERLYQELWVMLDYGEEQKLDEKTWKSLLGENISLQEQQNSCLDVASRQNIH